MIQTRITKNFSSASIAKQIPFATARAFTATAKDAQQHILGSIDDRLTIRSAWYRPSNKFGVRIKAARKNNLTAEIGTDADWMEQHETGGRRRPTRGRRLALPVIGELARKTLTAKVPRGSTPRKLLASGNAFIMKTRSGKVGIFAFKKGVKREVRDSIILNMAQRGQNGPGRPRNRYSDDVPFRLVYGLSGYRTFRKNSAIIEPALAIIQKRLNLNFAAALEEALRTSR